MSYYRTCPLCGAHLDPGEVCTDCREKKTALGAANAQDGKVEQNLNETDSTSTITEKRR